MSQYIDIVHLATPSSLLLRHGLERGTKLTAINPPAVWAICGGSSLGFRLYFSYAAKFITVYGILSVHGVITFTMLTSSFFFLEYVAGALG